MQRPGFLLRMRAHAGLRGRIALVLFATAAAVRLSSPAPPARSVEGVAAALGDAASADVRSDDFIWEARGGPIVDAIVGRRVLFLGAPRAEGAGASRDLYRARVRLTPDGRAIEALGVRGLSNTLLGDDRDLLARGSRAAFATYAYGAVQGVTLLDFAGDPAARAAPLADRVLGRLFDWIETGSLDGARRVEIAPSRAVSEVRFELTSRALVLALGAEQQAAALSFADGSLNPGPADAYGLRADAVPARPLPARLVQHLGETRAGAALLATIARAEGWIARAPSSTPAPRALVDLPIAAGGAWPPAPMAVPMSPPLEGEGVWTASLAGDAEAVPPAIVETRVRPDPSAPYQVLLVALDTRRLDLRFQAGALEPRALTGPGGRGRIPGEPVERVVAVLNGASQAGAPPAGAIAEGRVLVPAVAGAPTIAIERGGRSALGEWPASAAPGSLHLQRVGDVTALRQAPAWLLHHGALGPAADDARLAARSALALCGPSSLVYAWGRDVPASALARALALAGCDDAIPLGGALDGSGFALSTGCDPRPDAAAPRLVDAAMSLPPAATCERARDDFFYVVRVDPAPAAKLPESSAWAASEGSQPAPAWLPAVHEASVAKLGAEIHLTAFAPRRFAFRVRAGTEEPRRRSDVALPSSLADDDLARAVAAIGLGITQRRGGSGIVVDGAEGRPLRQDGAALVVNREGVVTIERQPGVIVPEGGSAVELPLTAEGGELVPGARKITSRRPRGAACMLEDETLVVATTTFDSDEAATSALLDLGCRRVVTLDRGSGEAHFLHRRGAPEPPRASYEASVLYALEAPARGRAGPMGE